MAFFRRTRFEQVWFLPVWLLLGLSRLAIAWLPFRHLARGLGEQAGNAPWIPLLTARIEARAWAIGRVVRLAAEHTPWDSHCFAQAVTARILLGVHGIPCVCFFGLARQQGVANLTAHAWVAAGRVPVTGGEGFDLYAVVGCYISSISAASAVGWD